MSQRLVRGGTMTLSHDESLSHTDEYWNVDDPRLAETSPCLIHCFLVPSLPINHAQWKK